MKTPTLTTINRVKVADVVVRERLRPVTEAGVESLIASITETGVLQDAIHVRKKKDGNLYLMIGAHRLEAAKRLGWEEIEAKVWTDVTDDWARIMEIDDNLAGAEMNALDTAVFLATRKSVYERLHPETKAAVGAALVSKRWNTADIVSVVSFAKAAADKFGIDERHVRRLVAAGSKLTPADTAQLRAAPRQITLKDLSVLAKIGSPTDRYAVVERLGAGRAKSAAEALKSLSAGSEMPPEPSVEAQFKALSNAWTRASAAARKRFLLEHRSEVWHAANAGAPLPRWQDADDSEGAAE